MNWFFEHELFTNWTELMGQLMRLFMGINGEIEKPFPLGRGWGRLPKIQQFWVIFQRFDINIFNFREHFSPRNFAFSAHNFALPSPNLN